MSGLGFIKEEKPRKCEFCGSIEETRPYGPNGERVCFACAMKDETAMERGFRRYVLGEKDDPN